MRLNLEDVVKVVERYAGVNASDGDTATSDPGETQGLSLSGYNTFNSNL